MPVWAWVIIGIVAWCLVLTGFVAMCRAAALGDEQQIDEELPEVTMSIPILKV